MLRGRFHPAFAWLFLIWFGLYNTVLASGLVACHDGHRGTRIEWGCDRNASGECSTSCGDDTTDDSGSPDPCQDTPIQDDHPITKAPPRPTGKVSVPLTATVAVLVLWAPVSPRTGIAWASAEPERPPDALRHIRTVLLLV